MAAKYDTEGSGFLSEDEGLVQNEEASGSVSTSNEDITLCIGAEDRHLSVDLTQEKGARNCLSEALPLDLDIDSELSEKHPFPRRFLSETPDSSDSSSIGISPSRSCPDLTELPTEQPSTQRRSTISKIGRRLRNSVKSRARSHTIEERGASGGESVPCDNKRSKILTETDSVPISVEEQLGHDSHAKNVSVVKRKSSLMDRFRKWLLDDFGIKERTNSSSDENLNSKGLKAQEDLNRHLAQDLLEIANCPFYWGDINRHEAEEYLHGLPEGTFLLRDSAQKDFLFSVSFRRYGRTFHARLHQTNHLYTFDSEEGASYTSPNVLGLLSRYSKAEFCMFFEPLLLVPFSRPYPFSLQHLCRATICDKVIYQHINTLPIPNALQDYLRVYAYQEKVKKSNKGSENKTFKRCYCR